MELKIWIFHHFGCWSSDRYEGGLNLFYAPNNDLGPSGTKIDGKCVKNSSPIRHGHLTSLPKMIKNPFLGLKMTFDHKEMR